VAEPASARDWALALYRRSVLKQRKLAELVRSLGATDGLRCLDLGSDNGVVSLLLRERGGSWASGDLTEEAVASIRSLVSDDVHLVAGDLLPFPDAAFDRVVVVDMLEHEPDEAAFARELARVTKPGGRLVVNTPHLGRAPRLRTPWRQMAARPPAPATLEGARSLGEVRPGPHLLPLLQAVITGDQRGRGAPGKRIARHEQPERPHHCRMFAPGHGHPLVTSLLRRLVPASGYMLIAAATRRPLTKGHHPFQPGAPGASR
jgi:SAM-dependent methyltransferase